MMLLSLRSKGHVFVRLLPFVCLSVCLWVYQKVAVEFIVCKGADFVTRNNRFALQMISIRIAELKMQKY